MVNAGDLFVCLIVGLAMPLALLDGLRSISGTAVQIQSLGTRFERRSIVWLSALLIGPGLFVERMLSSWREGELSIADTINAFVITLGWATIYGLIVLGLVTRLLPL
jgi:undecaprenyl pyrophosphate phosphatase UppP